MTNTRIFTLVAVGLLALSAITVPVLAKGADDEDRRGRRGGDDGDRDRTRDHRGRGGDDNDTHRKDGDHRKDGAHREGRGPSRLHGNVSREACMQASGNSSLNATDERDCMKVGEFAKKAFGARRAAHALLGAINATERAIARLNATEADLRAQLAGNATGDDGNGTLNATAIEKRLERIDAKQERLAERLADFQARLVRLHDKWDAVREHVADRRGHHDADEDAGSETSTSTSSESGSESESGSGSESESESESASESASHSETSTAAP